MRNSATALRDQTYGDAWVVDASASYKPSSNWTLTVGADNLLDKYPDRTEDLQNSTFGMLPYSNYSPFGFNGAYVYGRIKYKGYCRPLAGIPCGVRALFLLEKGSDPIFLQGLLHLAH